MAKERTVEIGGQVRVLRYTEKEREEIEDRFEKSLWDFVYGDVIQTNAAGRIVPGGRFKSQVAFLFYGLRHALPARFKEEKVREWVKELMASGASIYVALGEGASAVLESGVLGMTFELPAEDEPEGKEQAGVVASETPASHSESSGSS